jgi:ABC-type branched-subunit amino acid transport system ATPase component
MSNIMLKVDDLHVAYGQSEALHGISFDGHANETIAIMGRNGMGKTTLFKSLMGVLPIKSGASRSPARTCRATRASSAWPRASPTCRRAE